ncbi:type I-U CRISPR-associated protein Cas7 [bacterium]|nr:type I-U CRISPR-associated protein Cas7 [bacterium]
MSDSAFSFGGISLPAETKRLYVTAELVASNGDPRIQPTGFPDIGPVFYPDPSGEHGQICLIESEASMANRLEEVCVADKYTGTLRSELAGLPYIKVMKGEQFMTASTLDAHRFASQYLLEAKGTENSSPVEKDKLLVDYLKTELGASNDGKNVPAANVPRIFRLAMELDPLSLIHGFQISSSKLTFVGLRSPRALTASIVGLNAEPIGVPGVKLDPIGTSDTGQAIFRKERIVAQRIQANFAIDVGLLTGLAVGPEAGKDETDEQKTQRASRHESRRNLLVALALWKVARFLKDLSEGHRLRTECDLVLESAKYKTMWKGDSQDFPFEQIITDGEKMNGDKPVKGSLRDMIDKSELAKGRSPLTLEFGG